MEEALQPKDVKPPVAKKSRKLEKLKSEHERRGIVYISRLPPHMVRMLTL